MKLNKPFVLQDICDMQVAVSPEYKGIIRLEGSGALIFQALTEGTTEEALLETLCQRYDAPREEIRQDIADLLSQLREAGLLDE